MAVCPRCEAKEASVIARSPVKGAWELYQCPTCFFIWRSTEPEFITDPAKYNPAFKVTPNDVAGAVHVPPIAPRRQG
ncbi:MAG: hypothetical protein K6T63_04225 [Alicyclobacillus herbarius]|uniref:non-oxidative hydroxyarylic acid decarboxylases subunit D n=1 Tax=Alicyclobacillus herbarius TaxID=122960 RepID=UPI0023537DF8|nr:non-oxidative hydroxyarylic acid decarboxylases subunit D [Alicyclobacillus herbarius]MCL6631819.1 hypothetical protein [Alicyclobacillus herbarius]